ncbi:MAG: DUF5320 domain-containing protein, partial [Candidatus Hydrogenedentes bacterium]|nr:DUF5320 domain-containing protein [Candidatus Hydrogenedentota bacterium]
MGRGMGRGMGQGFQAGPVAAPQQPSAPAPTRTEELAMLREQARAMQEGLKQLEERIHQLTDEEGGDSA